MKNIIAACIAGFFIISAFGAVAQQNNVKNQNVDTQGDRTFTHTVFAEDGTATWCPHCPYAHGSLHRIYMIGQYPLLYTSLVADKNKNAAARDTEYNIYGYPTIWFDGGYQVDVGSYDNWTQQMSWYNQSIIQSGAMTVPDIFTTLNVKWLGNATMHIQVSVQNNATALYAGHIRVYVTEVESSMGWIDTQGYKYTFPFLDYAFNENISVAAGDTWTDSTTWDGHNYNDGYGHNFGSIQNGNIMIIAAVFNAASHQGYSNPPSGKPFQAYYVDDAAGFYVGTGEPNTPYNPYPTNGATNVSINNQLSWNGGGPPRNTITYDVYFGTINPPPKVTSNQSTSTYHLATMNIGTTYYWKIVAWDQDSNSAQGPIWHFTTHQAPSAPTITGPAQGKPETSYTFVMTSTDPDSNTLYYFVDWGDNTTTAWAGPYASGVAVSLSHTWSTKGTYSVKAKVKDFDGRESTWGTLPINIPTNQYIPHFTLMELLKKRLEWFPLLERFLIH